MAIVAIRPVSLVILMPLPLLSVASAQTAQDVPIRHCPDLMDFYPQQALREGMTGKATYVLVINPVGAIQEITLSQSSGQPLLDEAGMRFLKQCKFLPTNNPNATIRRTVRSVTFTIP